GRRPCVARGTARSCAHGRDRFTVAVRSRTMTLGNRGRRPLTLWAGLLVGLATAPGCQYSMSIAWPPVSEQFAQRQTAAPATALKGGGELEPAAYQYPSRYAQGVEVAHQAEQGPDPRPVRPQPNGQPKAMDARPAVDPKAEVLA